MHFYGHVPKSASEATTALSLGAYPNPFASSSSHATTYSSSNGWGGLSTRTSFPSAGPLLGSATPALPPLTGDVGLPAGLAPFGRSVSHALTPPPTFQFKFDGTGDIAGGGLMAPQPLLLGGRPTAAAAHAAEAGLAAKPPCAPEAGNGKPPNSGEVGPTASTSSSTARGREGVLRRLSKQAFGVTQEPIGCTMQLDECIARCRREVQEVAARCRARGQKFVDPEFPADDRALYVNGRGSVPELPPDERPVHWKRASERAFADAKPPMPPPGHPAFPGPTAPPPHAPPPPAMDDADAAGGARIGAEVLVPGPLLGVQLLGALATMRSGGKDPRELIVWREPEAGVYGVRLFKDGEWMYEVLDDLLPLTSSDQPACSRSYASGEVQDWVALIEKAYAKAHGSYEAAAARGAEAEALEDVTGWAASRMDITEFPVWGEMWQHLRSRRSRGFVQLAVRRGPEAPGEVLTDGLLSGYGYPISRLELIDGEMLCELENPWPLGRWNGRWGLDSREMLFHRHCRQLDPGPETCHPFWMGIQDFCRHFTDVIEVRMVPSFWQSAAVTCSSERPSYPLLSVSSATQAIFSLSQVDRRWSQDEEYPCAIGLRVYRCRIVAPPQNAVGVRQNVSSPFKNLELLVERPPARVHSVVLEVARLEPACLYIAAVDMGPNCPRAVLRVLTASAPRFRELSAPESSYFLQAQPTAPQATDSDSFSSQGSIDLANTAAHSPRGDPMRNGSESRSCDGSSAELLNLRSWQDCADDADLKVPTFLKACINSCNGDC